MLVSAILALAPLARAASDITITTAATSGGAFSGGDPEVFTATAATANAQASTIQAALLANKTVQVSTVSASAAPGDLTVSTALSKNTSGAATLSLTATRHLALGSGISGSTGQLHLNLSAGGDLTVGSTIATNGGAVVLQSGGVVSLGSSNSINAGAGAITLASGALSATGTPTLTTAAGFQAASGTTLALRANITGPASVAGTLSPAGPNAAGTFQVNGALALAPTTTTVIELGGTSAGTGYDRVNATGAVTLAGVLQVSLINSFHDTISASTTFTIVQGGSVSGTFAGLANGSRYTLPGDLGTMRINYTATTVTLADWQPVITDLAWDAGTAEAGTAVATHTATRAGRHYYRLTTQATDIGAWRTRLTLGSGEAALYLSAGTLPTPSASNHSSVQTGSEGVVLRDDQYTAGSTWYILVHAAEAGAQWNLLSGRAYVHNLGALPFTDTNTNGQYDIGEAVSGQTSPAAPMPPEGIRFYQASLPLGTPAWSLWLQGSTRPLALRTGKVPFQTSTAHYTRRQAGQMLVVPPVLGAGAGVYFLSVVAPMGESIGLDSRIQTVQDIGFSSTTGPIIVDGAPYRVFRVSVPVDQIAWDIAVTPLSGDPQLALRKSEIPGEWDNHAFSEAPSPARDSITLVPEYLSNGTWFITVYGTGAYEFTLQSGHPTVTPIAYNDLKVNDLTTRAGWRYYSLTDIAAQNGSLGWELALANQVPGTRVAIRRNKVPSLWTYRSGGSTTVQTSGNYWDFSGIGFLQRPGHQADVWYVGVYTPGEALGAFSLDTQPITATSQTFDESIGVVADLAAGRWNYHTLTVPAGVLAWDLRLTDVSGPRPTMVIRRDLLPSGTGTSGGWPVSSNSPTSSNAWTSGLQWAASSGSNADWTGWTNNPSAGAALPRLLMASGRPLEPGTYFVGVYNSDASASTSYILDSRGVGAAGSGFAYEVAPALAFNGGSATITNLAPREARYFKITVPADTPSWELTLGQTSGELLLAVRHGAIPDFSASSNGDVLSGNNQLEMQRTGPERYVLLPASNQPSIQAGDYYIAVVSEGQNPGTPSTTIGTGTASGVLTSHGPLTVTALGTASNTGLVHPVSLLAGQIQAFTFQVPADTLSLEVRLANAVGAPGFRIVPGTRIPTASDSYGNDGGGSGTSVSPIHTVAAPAAGTWTAIVQAPAGSAATANLVFTTLNPQGVTFSGGTLSIADQPAGTWRYFNVTVPSGLLAWDLRLTDITGPRPTMVIRRDLLPSGTGTSGGWPVTSNSPTGSNAWPSGLQWAAGTGSSADWTGWTNNPGAGAAPARLLMASGRPLEPGDYVIGIYNSDTSLSSSYTLDSRGVGPAGSGQAYEVAPALAFNGGSATITDLAPREARYFKITVPADTPSWELTLGQTSGELLLAVRHGAIPDFSASSNGDVLSGNNQLEMQRTGPERYVLLPASNQPSIQAGDYYLAVVSEGQSPGASTVGTGTASGVLTSHGPLAVTALGSASNAGLVHPVSLLAGQIQAFTFQVPANTLSLEVRLADAVGAPGFRITPGARIPTASDSYGNDGGGSGTSVSPVYTLASPTTGTWTAIVQAPSGSAATANLVFTALSPQTIGFESTTALAAQPAGSWRYFNITVPAGVLAWDLRLTDVSGPRPSLVIRRDLLPSGTGTSGGWPVTSNSPTGSNAWPTGLQWAAGTGSSADWTGWTNNPGAGSAPARLLMASGRPLEPGDYVIGIYNSDTSLSTGYTLDSRGVGATGSGLAYEVAPALAFNGGSATITNLAPREARYFKITVPAATPSWELTLGQTSGELLLAVRHGAIPDFTASSNGDVLSNNNEVKMQRAGPERYVLLPASSQTSIPAGDYYLAVVSEGQSPGSTTVGTGTASGVLTSHGPLAVTALGSASDDGLVHPVSLVAGQIQAFTFLVPADTLGLEVRLADAVGSPNFRVVPGTRIPSPSADYGNDGGGSGASVAPIHTVVSPTAGIWTALVQAPSASAATANLVFRTPPRLGLSFASSLNGETGLSHTSTRQLLDGQKDYYAVTVPATLAGQPVLGWLLNVAHHQGDTTLKIHRTWGNTANDGLTITGNSALLVPPYLTAGDTWYVEVTGTGATHYTLTSRAVELSRPAWTMPLGHNSTFGDTGTDSGGQPLPGDRGTDLAASDWHFYAVDIPEGNAGLLRTELLAISGNPNLYLREDGVPSPDHDSNGSLSSGTNLAPRSLTQTASEYGNWVPLDGRTERHLRPGRWYLGVKAEASNARYRLLVSNGQVADLDLTNGAVAAQSLLGRDWRYYRVSVPEDAPLNWTLTFTRPLGDVVMHLRDTTPPGNGESPSDSHLRDWSDDDKNSPFPLDGYETPGAYTFTTPVLRPGHVYYVGFRARADSTFTLSSAVSGGTIGTVPFLSFYGGTVALDLPASGSALYRIPVPADATRLKWAATHAASVQLRLEQGTLPLASGAGQHHASTTANASLNQALSAASWPWQPGQTYYLRIVNNGAATAAVSLTLDGENAGTEDEDVDGLLDAWERQYFGNLAQTGAGDPDGDGVTNAVEFADGTAPDDIASALYFLNVSASGGGSVAVSPELPKYARGTVVTLTATPPAGSVFIGWSGTATSQSNPWALTMLANHTLAPVSGIPLDEALDTTAAGLTWTAGGANLWRGQGLVSQDGQDSAQSAPIDHGEESWIETTVTGPGILHYFWKVSSQANGDWLEFRLDGALQPGRVSGNLDWLFCTHEIPSGVHTLRWRYVKDANTVAGSDAAWVDGVSWTPIDPYLGWANDYFDAEELENPAISGPLADPDGDGRANLLEYALGGVPDVADTVPGGTLVRVGPNWFYRYTRPAGRVGVTYAVETSPALETATRVWTPRTETIVSITAGVETVEAPVPAPAPRLFGRVVVELEP